MSSYRLFSSAFVGNILTSLGKKDFVLLETTKIRNDEHKSLLFSNPVDRLICTAQDSPEQFLNHIQTKLDQGYYLAGWFAYEFGYLLEPVLAKRCPALPDQVIADFGVFSKPAVYDHFSQSSSGGDWPDEILNTQNHLYSKTGYNILNVHPDKKEETYLHNIHRIKEYIAAGDTYQVNFTLKLLFDFAGSPVDFYRILRRNQSVCYGAYIQSDGHQTMSFSPELFFRKRAQTCTVRPMKGTLKRGRSLEEDKEYAKFLCSDSKNRSENVMIVDLLRNDVGRLARMGGVHVSSLFDVETFETLHQMTSTITAELQDSISLHDLLKALFPCGSVTGAPKIRTMEIIRELEQSPRGVYTGAIGYFSPDGDAVFNVPIRTVVVKENKGEMGIGSGIIHDSDPNNEWEECLLKAHFLTKPQKEIQLIETLLWKPCEGYWLLEKHLDRLKDSATYFDFLFDLNEVKTALELEAAKFSQKAPQRVRLLLAKNGELTITHTECTLPSLHPPEKDQEDLPRIRISNERTHSGDRFLYHKTTNRNLYDDERKKAVRDGYYEILFLNEKDEISEGSISTVFIEKNQCFFTPPLHCGLLPGVFRSYILEHSQPYPVREKILTLADLHNADAIYVGNSVRGLTKVSL